MDYLYTDGHYDRRYELEMEEEDDYRICEPEEEETE